MSWLKDFAIFCDQEKLDRFSFAARRAFETGVSEVRITGDRALTMDDVDALTGAAVGTFNTPCPYCGVEKLYSTRMKIERLTLARADYRCFYCGKHGTVRTSGPIDPEKEAEARNRADAREKEKQAQNQARALRIWGEAVSIKSGDPVTRYLAARAIHELPPQVDEVLRFHPRCPFALGTRPCLIGLMRDVLTNEARAITRIAVQDNGHSLGKWTLGSPKGAAAKLWGLSGDRLVIGEGIETVLAAATGLKWREPLKPAWALTVANNVAAFPVIEAVQRLRILVDNDLTGTGPRKSNICAANWRRTGREVILLTPNQKGADFNDVVMAR